jgi:hypothetical protein
MPHLHEAVPDRDRALLVSPTSIERSPDAGAAPGAAESSSDDEDEGFSPVASTASQGSDGHVTPLRGDDDGDAHIEEEDDPVAPAAPAAPVAPAAPAEPSVIGCDLITANTNHHHAADDTDAGSATFILRRKQAPPTAVELAATMTAWKIPAVVYEEPFYGRPADLPARPPLFSGKSWSVPTAAISHLPPFCRSCADGAGMRAATGRRAGRRMGAAEAWRRSCSVGLLSGKTLHSKP